MAINADLLHESIEIAVSREPVTTRRFYEILIAALSELCGDEWTVEHEASQVAVCGALADLAVAGANRARAQA